MAGYLAAGVGGAISIAFIWLTMRYALRRSAIGVVRALRRNPDRQYQVQVHKWALAVGAWNPGQPLSRNGQVFGTGTATYRLLDGDRVDLVWTPADGHAAHFAGEVPAQVDVAGPAHRRRKLVVVGILVLYVLVAAAGFTVGYLVSSGAVGHRVGMGLGGVFVGLASIWVVFVFVASIHGSKTALAHSRES